MRVTLKVSLVKFPEAALVHCPVEDTVDAYNRHFGPSSKDLSNEKRDLVDQKEWKTSKARLGKLGNTVEYNVGETVKHAQGESPKLSVCPLIH